MIQITSSFSHFLYVLLSSTLSDLFCCFFCFSEGWRLRGSISSVGCAGELVTVAPDWESPAAGLSPWALAGMARAEATAKITKNEKRRKPTRDMRGTPAANNVRRSI